MDSLEKNVNQFNKDIRTGRSYKYTSGQYMSSTIANQRITEEVLKLVSLRDKRVIDVGCGDGAYTIVLADSGATRVLGVDAADGAIAIAARRAGWRTNVSFKGLSIYDLYTLQETFDVAVVRGALHHLDRPDEAIQSIVKIAEHVVIVEPNGFNPIVKIIEKCSCYHREHGEKSYSPSLLNKWFSQAGADLELFSYIGFVPYFCPSLLATVLKTIEPFIEAIPLIRHVFCAQYTAAYSIRKKR
jgi:SAM-dependent methyltransferase